MENNAFAVLPQLCWHAAGLPDLSPSDSLNAFDGASERLAKPKKKLFVFLIGPSCELLKAIRRLRTNRQQPWSIKIVHLKVWLLTVHGYFLGLICGCCDFFEKIARWPGGRKGILGRQSVWNRDQKAKIVWFFSPTRPYESWNPLSIKTSIGYPSNCVPPLFSVHAGKKVDYMDFAFKLCTPPNFFGQILVKKGYTIWVFMVAMIRKWTPLLRSDLQKPWFPQLSCVNREVNETAQNRRLFFFAGR